MVFSAFNSLKLFSWMIISSQHWQRKGRQDRSRGKSWKNTYTARESRIENWKSFRAIWKVVAHCNARATLAQRLRKPCTYIYSIALRRKKEIIRNVRFTFQCYYHENKKRDRLTIEWQRYLLARSCETCGLSRAERYIRDYREQRKGFGLSGNVHEGKWALTAGFRNPAWNAR